MRVTPVDIVLFLIFLAFPQRALTQEAASPAKGCGSDTIQVGQQIQEFKIPNSDTDKFQVETECNYHLKAQEGTRIHFTITELKIGLGGNCLKSYIKVSDTLLGIKDTKYTFCGTKLPSYSFRSTSNEAFIQFKIAEDFATSFVKGNLIAVPLIDPACGPQNLTLDSSSATLQIPEAGKKFTAPTMCFYAITGSDEKKLSLEITSIHLGNDGQCKDDYIKVSSSVDTLETSNYSYCGSKAPTDKFFSTTNKIFIAMATSSNVDKTSITAIYSKVNFVSKLESSTMVVLLMLALVAIY